MHSTYLIAEFKEKLTFYQKNKFIYFYYTYCYLINTELVVLVVASLRVRHKHKVNHFKAPPPSRTTTSDCSKAESPKQTVSLSPLLLWRAWGESSPYTIFAHNE